MRCHSGERTDAIDFLINGGVENVGPQRRPITEPAVERGPHLHLPTNALLGMRGSSSDHLENASTSTGPSKVPQ